MYHVKRAREEEDAGIEEGAATCKRMRTLPFRSSPTSQHTSLFSTSTWRQIPKPPSLTPAESSDEDSEIDFQSPDYQSKPTIPTFVNTDADMDYDMGDAEPMTSPLWSPKTSTNSTLLGSGGGGGSSGGGGLASPAYPQLLTVRSSDSLDASTRIPTPIYGHFTNLQRTTIANANSPTAANPPPAGVVRVVNEQNDAFLRRRRLPSPICEDTSFESPINHHSIDTIVESPICATSGQMDSPTTINMLRGLDVRGTPLSATFPSHSVTASVGSATGYGRRKSSAESTSSSSSGRRRSDAVSGGESHKMVFSMGFRADCEKCRERVPGHYSHVLRV